MPEAARRRQLRVNRSHRDFPAAGRCRLAAGEASRTPLSVPHRPQAYVRPSHRADRAVEEERRRPKGLPQLGAEGG